MSAINETKEKIRIAATTVFVAIEEGKESPISSAFMQCSLSRRALAIAMLKGLVEIDDLSIKMFERYNDDLKRLLAL